jgi:CHC2 zinc finger
MIDSPIQKLLSRLENVKQNGPEKWVGCCPSHEDKTPSLSIKEAGDGVVLLKCWAGCNAAEIVAACGLELHDLFPKVEHFGHHTKQKIDRRPWSSSDVLRALIHEVTVVAVCAGKLKNAGLTNEDSARLLVAIQRLFSAAGTVNL